MHGEEPGRGGFIANWIDMLDEAREQVVSKHGTEGRAAERAMEQAGVKVSLANLRTFPCVSELEKQGRLRLRGAFFAISDGVLHLLEEASGSFDTVENRRTGGKGRRGPEPRTSPCCHADNTATPASTPV